MKWRTPMRVQDLRILISRDIYKQTKYLKNKGFITFYSIKLKIPLVSLTVLEWSDVRSRIKRRNSFRQDRRFSRKNSPSNRDYKHSGYDRGHLIANAFKDFDLEHQHETFLLTNVAPQSPRANRWVWAMLEHKVLLMTKFYGRVSLAVGVIPSESKTIGRSVNVPDAFFMVVFAHSVNMVRVYIVPNNNQVNKQNLLKGRYRVNLRYLNSVLTYKIKII